MTNDPEQIRRDIEQTRHELGADVEALGERISPAQAVQRRVDRIRDSAAEVKDTIMGTAGEAAESTRESVRSTASDVADSASAAASSVASSAASSASSAADTAASVDGAVRSLPQEVRRRARGNPLAAGLIAFGAGWLISSLLPPTRREQQVAGDAADLARQGGEHVAPHLDQVRSEVEDNLRGPASEAAASVRSTAGDAASRVAEESRAAAGHLTDRAAEAKERVQDPSASR